MRGKLRFSAVRAFVNAIALERMLQLRNVSGSKAKDRNRTVLEQNEISARLRAVIEEELGSYQRFADATSVEIDGMANRLVRAIAPLLAREATPRESTAA